MASAEALQTQYAYLPLFSQKGANMLKQLFSRYNIGSIMSVIFQERLQGTLLKLYVNIPTHGHLLQFQKSVRCIT